MILFKSFWYKVFVYWKFTQFPDGFHIHDCTSKIFSSVWLNPVFWLATWAARLRFPALVPQEKFSFWPYNKSYIDQPCLVKIAGCYPRSFFFFAFLLTLTLFQSIKKQTRTWSIASHLYSLLGSNIKANITLTMTNEIYLLLVPCWLNTSSL